MAQQNTERKQQVMDGFVAACLDATDETLPEGLYDLIYKAKENLPVRDEDKEGPPTDSETRKYIYQSLFDFLSRERGVGHGASLVYPEELLATVRSLYPDGVKNYRPVSGKRKRFYEVTLKELIEEYKELK